MNHTKKKFLIIGAGLSGLACALTLYKAGHSVQIFERNLEVGGRVKTNSTTEGYLLDEGFQVLLDSYPEISRFFSPISSLELQPFRSGAMVYSEGKWNVLANIVKHPQFVFQTLNSKVFNFKDAYLTLKLLVQIYFTKVNDTDWSEQSTLNFLQQYGFSKTFIDKFWQPFLLGVFLDPSLSVRKEFFQFLLKCFSFGRATLPKYGMQTIPKTLMQQIPIGSFNFNSKILSWKDRSIEVEGLGEVHGDQVICAFDPEPHVLDLPEVSYREVTTYYYEIKGQIPKNLEGWLLLVPQQEGFSVHHLTIISSVSKSYGGTRGAHILSASIVGPHENNEIKVNNELIQLLGNSVELKFLRKADIKKALPIHAEKSDGFCVHNGVVYCGDRWTSPSINGALKSGRLAAEWLLNPS